MKVCIIVNEYPPDRIAGTAVVTQAIAKILQKNDVEISIIVTERSDASPAVSDDEGVIVHRIRTGKIRFFRWLFRLFLIRRMVGRIKPDILHGQAVSCGLYAAVAAFGRNLPVLTSIQGRDLYDATPFQRRTEIRWALKRAAQVITVNQELADLGHNLFGISDIRVIHNGFTPETIETDRNALRAGFGVAQGEMVLATVARLTKTKGIDILLNAVKGIPHATVWIIGDGEEKEALQNLSESLNLSHSVHFLGLMPHHSVAERLKAADLFVLPSRLEPFGISILEAMHAGLPVVATHTGGIPELVGTENGILVPVEDSQALSAAISNLIKDPRRRLAMSSANAAKADRYHWNRIGETYLTTYRSLSRAGQ